MVSGLIHFNKNQKSACNHYLQIFIISQDNVFFYCKWYVFRESVYFFSKENGPWFYKQ